MTLSQEQITRLGKLTALQADAHIEIDTVLQSFDAITNANTDAVANISRSGKSALSPRADEIHENNALPDQLLACSSQKVAAHQIVLAGIMQGE